MKSRVQQKKRRESRNRKIIRRGGRPGSEIDNTLWKVSYEVLCNENPDVPKISACDLFSMIESGLYAMAKGRAGYPILGAQNGRASNLDKHLPREAYRIELMVWFEEEMNSDLLNEWKVGYLEAIHKKELFQNGSYNPIEDSFTFTAISQEEYDSFD
jgi:hypothetical protein